MKSLSFTPYIYFLPTWTCDNKRDVDLLVASIQNGKVNSFKTAVKMLQIPVQRTVLLLSINPKEDDNKKDDD